MNIGGQLVVITGGGSGIGAGTARYFAEKAAKVAIFDRDRDKAKQVADEINATAFICDVTNAAETEKKLQEMVEQLGVPRVCINCAGIAPARKILSKDGVMPLEEFAKAINVNLIGTFNMLRLCAQIMADAEPMEEDLERGVIINTASIAAFDGQIGQTAYSASKGGICALTLPAARELAEHHIRVMTIAPGLVYTPMLEGLPEKVVDNLTSLIPYPKRFGSTEEFAKLAMHIVENRLLNGEVIRLDGALRMPAR